MSNPTALPFNTPVILTSDDAGFRPKNIGDDIVDFMSRFIIFPDRRQADVLALWVLHTHCFDAAYATPYIYVNSQEPGSGKTRVIEVLSTLARAAERADSISSAAMFRLISDVNPTLLIDEVDAVFTGAANDDLRGVLNSGYKRGGSVMRFTGKETEKFFTFCPKLLAGLDNGEIPATIADRCISITLRKKGADQTVERFMWRKVEADAEGLAERIGQWTQANLPALLDAEPDVIDGISDRAFEIAEPLLAIADRLRGWHNRGREAVTFLNSGGPKPLTPPQKALDAARQYMTENDSDRMPSAVLAEMLDMSGKRISGLLSPMGIQPVTFRFNGKPTKGYLRASMQDAFDRFLP